MNVLQVPAFTAILGEELKAAGLASTLAELSHGERCAVEIVEIQTRALLRTYISHERSQAQRRAAAAMLLACARFAATSFVPGDKVTCAWYEPGEPDGPEGVVVAVEDRQVTVRWRFGPMEELDAVDLRHDAQKRVR